MVLVIFVPGQKKSKKQIFKLRLSDSRSSHTLCFTPKSVINILFTYLWFDNCLSVSNTLIETTYFFSFPILHFFSIFSFFIFSPLTLLSLFKKGSLSPERIPSSSHLNVVGFSFVYRLRKVRGMHVHQVVTELFWHRDVGC